MSEDQVDLDEQLFELPRRRGTPSCASART
jgi:hypothetical protein